ncbi:hypothetical protein FDP41_009796 [Naegleria fowleri]|uniref:Uncharacterized protein n=1 Tax=Naegleria fowleri TaxID=5763 RepID=A0A6A5BDE5_NAEFO|nr:uncharacterized protein FDP41_009796 [Naegleria fowleri]KAF0972100.1 hypothetical protein FDP41_009796 [Naegleria fowleri]CAG4713775.1 unnamed protein product [Naegleria fowleri]
MNTDSANLLPPQQQPSVSSPKFSKSSVMMGESSSLENRLRILLPPIQQQQQQQHLPQALSPASSAPVSSNTEDTISRPSVNPLRNDSETSADVHRLFHHVKIPLHDSMIPQQQATSQLEATPNSKPSFPLSLQLQNLLPSPNGFSQKEPELTSVRSISSKSHSLRITSATSTSSSPQQHRIPPSFSSTPKSASSKLQAPLSARVRKSDYWKMEEPVIKQQATPPSKASSSFNGCVSCGKDNVTLSTTSDEVLSPPEQHNSSRKSPNKHHERHWNTRIDRKLKDLEFFYSGGPTRVCHMKYLDDEDTSYYNNISLKQPSSPMINLKDATPKPAKIKQPLTPEVIEKRRKNKERLKSINEKLHQCKQDIKKTHEQVEKRMEQLELLERLANKSSL